MSRNSRKRLLSLCKRSTKLGKRLPQDCLPIQSQILNRYANFLNSCLNSNNSILKLLSSLALQGSGSQMANNCNLIKSVYRIDYNGIVTGSSTVFRYIARIVCNLHELSIAAYKQLCTVNPYLCKYLIVFTVFICFIFIYWVFSIFFILLIFICTLYCNSYMYAIAQYSANK